MLEKTNLFLAGSGSGERVAAVEILSAMSLLKGKGTWLEKSWSLIFDLRNRVNDNFLWCWSWAARIQRDNKYMLRVVPEWYYILCHISTWNRGFVVHGGRACSSKEGESHFSWLALSVWGGACRQREEAASAPARLPTPPQLSGP